MAEHPPTGLAGGAAPPPPPMSRPGLAFVWMLGAIASFTLMALAGREAQAEINAFELMAWRSALGWLAICAVLAWHPRGFAQIRPQRGWWHVQRNLFHFTGQIAWFMALTMIPLAQLVAFEFTNPIWVALLAPLVLGERLTARRAVAVGLGFVGIMIVAQPGVGGFGLGQGLALLSALCFALNTMWTRRIMAHDTVLCVLFWMTASQALMGLAGALALGTAWPPVSVWLWIGIVAFTGLSAHYCLTSALGQAPASIVAPMDFLRLPAVTVVGAMIYAESVQLAVLLGAGFIIAANMLNMTGGTARRASAPRR